MATNELPRLTMKDLKAVSAELLHLAAEYLKEDHDLTAAVAIIRPDRSVHIAPLPGAAFNNKMSKEKLMVALKIMCEVMEAQGIIMVSDGWSLHQTPEQLARTCEPAFLEIAERGGVPATAAAGYGDLMETIAVTAQTKDCLYSVIQQYQRVANDGVIPGSAVYAGDVPEEYTIRLFGEPIEMPSSETAATGGRMAEILYEGAASHA
jgi:hypothetical protein